MELGLAITCASMATKPAGKVERQEAQRIHGVFNLWTKSPQEDHVAYDVRPAAMQEHRRQNCDPVMTGDDFCGNDRPLQDKCVPAHQFGQEHQDIDQYDQRR